MNNSVKVGFCVAYDWAFLAHALPLVYESADTICLSVDEDRVSWANKPFSFDEQKFDNLIRSIDVSGKINVYQDNFHKIGLTPAQNEVRQRRLMSQRMGSGGWHIQLDCDEYFLDFHGFVKYLKAFPDRSYPFNVCCQFVTLLKKVDKGFLYIDPEQPRHAEYMQVASRTPAYEHGRRNNHFNVIAPFLLIHQSWARDEHEILQKLSNWGHKDDFDRGKYFDFWKHIDESNFKNVRRFHPIQPDAWPSLNYIECADLHELIVKFQPGDFPSLTPVSRMIRNSRVVSAVRSRLQNLLDRVRSKQI